MCLLCLVRFFTLIFWASGLDSHSVFVCILDFWHLHSYVMLRNSLQNNFVYSLQTSLHRDFIEIDELRTQNKTQHLNVLVQNVAQHMIKSTLYIVYKQVFLSSAAMLSIEINELRTQTNKADVSYD